MFPPHLRPDPPPPALRAAAPFVHQFHHRHDVQRLRPSLPYGRDYDYCYCCRNDDPASSSPPSHLPSLLCHRCTSRPIGDHILSPCNPDSLSPALLSLCTLRMRGAQLSDTVGLCSGRSLAPSLAQQLWQPHSLTRSLFLHRLHSLSASLSRLTNRSLLSTPLLIVSSSCI